MHIIITTLVFLLIDKDILTRDKTKPLEPFEYISQVLVPETAIILISQDLKVSLENAREIMNDSLKFGNYVHDIDINNDETSSY